MEGEGWKKGEEEIGRGPKEISPGAQNL